MIRIAPIFFFLVFAVQLHGLDTMQAHKWLVKAQSVNETSYPEALKFSGYALKESEKVQWNEGVCRALLIRASAHMRTTELSAGKDEIQRAITLAEQSGQKILLLKGLFEMSGMYNLLGDYPKSMEYAIQAERIAREIGDPMWKGQAILRMGVIHNYAGDTEKALRNYEEALTMAKIAKDTPTISNVLSSKAIILCIGGNCQAAVGLFQTCISLAKASGDFPALAKYYSNLGNTKLYLNQPQSAYEDFQTSIQIARRIGDHVQLALSLGNTAFALNDLKRYPDAIAYVIRSIDTAAIVGSLDDLNVGWQLLSELYAKTGQYEKAYDAVLNYEKFKDSLAVDDKKSKIRNLEQKLEFRKREEVEKAKNEATLQKQVWMRNVFIAGFALALLFAGVFLFQRKKTEKQRQRSEELLLNILPKEIAEELKSNGSAKAQQFDPVSVLFLDIVGFTKIAQAMSPQELVSELDTLYSRFDDIVNKHGLEKIKTVGDAYMAVCGLPQSNPAHALNTIRAAIDIIAFTKEYAIARLAQKHEPFEIRAGIHSGPVVAGIVGKTKFAYDIWGDTVNTAARMEQNSEPGKINISGETYTLVATKVKANYRGKIEAKNKGAVDMYYVESLTDNLPS